MKIGIVTQSYYPVLGGVTEHVWHLGRELERRGHAVTVITGGTKDPDDRGLRVLRHGIQIPLTGNGANVHMTLGWKLGGILRKIEERECFDIVHIQCPVDPGLPLIASRAMRSPKVGTHHSYRDNHVFSDLIFRVFRPVFDDAVRKISCHIAVSPSAEASCRRYYPNVNITVIPNGIDITRFSPSVQPMLNRDDGTFTVLFVGRMDPRKGAKYLFGALPYLEERLQKYRVLVVGSGWMKKYYDTYIPFALRRRVTFAGFASPEDLPRYYRSADIYCSPATGGESFGIVLLEAMASGVPIVASDIDGYRHVLTEGREGVFCRPRDPRSIADRIIELAQDDKRRQQLGSAGRKTAEQYDWKRITGMIERMYRTVTSDQKQG
ncbi:MAG: glycosyltransferase family 4 protein [Candidatus Kerfeldbacteria bacterium]